MPVRLAGAAEGKGAAGAVEHRKEGERGGARGDKRAGWEMDR